MNREEVVKEFHTTFQVDDPIEGHTNILNPDINRLRVGLIQEELNELIEGLNKKDPIEVLDALCDLQYVLSGTIVQLGFQDMFEAAFKEVHRSNMSKKCPTLEIAKEVAATQETKCDIIHVGEGEHIVLRGDRKVIKSSTYSEANLKEVYLMFRDKL